MMNNNNSLTLYSLVENSTNGYTTYYLNIDTVACIIFAIFVIVDKNPVFSVLFLIGLFFSIAGFLMMIGINYLGLSYLLVYVGAVSILFLFILMLISIRISELSSFTYNSVASIIITVLFFNFIMVKAVPIYTDFVINTSLNTSPWFTSYTDQLEVFYIYKLLDNSIKYGVSGGWDSNLLEISHIGSIGNILYTSHSMWLVLTSIVLLLAMVGAIIITVRQRK